MHGIAPRWIVEQKRPGESEPYLRVARDGQRYLLVHRDGLELVVTEEPAVTITRLDDDISSVHLEHILLDQVLPLVMSALGRLSLHASAVVWDGQAIAFLAPSGGGKSTTAGCAVERCGASLLADDQAVLEPTAAGWRVHPSYPSVRLLEDAAGELFGLPSTRDRKQRVPLRAHRVPAPLAAIVLLDQEEYPLPARRVGPRDALVGIALHVDRLDPTDRRMLQAELDLLTRLVQGVPTVRVTMAHDLEGIAPSIDAIRQVVAGNALSPDRAPGRSRDRAR